jgi:hypothetical protein
MEDQMNQNLAADLAMSMGVSVADLMCLARSVANSIQQDRAESAFLKADDSVQVEITAAYVPVAVKKHQAFVAAYLTRPAAKREFNKEVLRLALNSNQLAA